MQKKTTGFYRTQNVKRLLTSIDDLPLPKGEQSGFHTISESIGLVTPCLKSEEGGPLAARYHPRGLGRTGRPGEVTGSSGKIHGHCIYFPRSQSCQTFLRTNSY